LEIETLSGDCGLLIFDYSGIDRGTFVARDNPIIEDSVATTNNSPPTVARANR
jgi:hypothetical protein